MNITKFLNKVYFAPRLKEIEQYTSHAGELQQLVLQRLVRTAANTEWGKKHDYASIRTYEDFKKRLPIQTYEEVKPYVTRLRAGEQNLLWPRKYVGLPNHRVPPTTRVSSCPSAGSPCTTRITREAGMPLPSIWDRIPKVVSFPVKAYPWRQPRSQPEHQPQSCRRPLRHPHRKYQPTGKLCPRTQQADSLDGALRAQNGGHCPRNHPCKCKQPFRCTVLDACTHQTYTGKDGKAEPRRDMAQPGGILPRRRCLHSLPRAIQRRDPQQQDALCRDL